LRQREAERRHRRLAVASGVLSTLVLLVGALAFAAYTQRNEARYQTGVATTALGKARDERDRAEKEKKTAQARDAETSAVLGFVESKIFAAARPQNLGREVTLRRAVEEALPSVADDFLD